MAGVTVAELAKVVGVRPERLLQQMRYAGLTQKSDSESVTDHDKQVLLAYLKASHGEHPESRTITLKNKKTVNVTVRNTAVKVKVPKVFLSYSYDSNEHELWVEQLAKMLRSDGVEAILDRWYLHPGDPITEFMETNIKNSDFVLIICTEKYKQKSDSRLGGVGYEEAIISADMFSNSNHRKYIPVLKAKDYSKAVPIALHSKKYVNLTSEEVFSPSYRDLLLTLYGRRPTPPPIGEAPEFVHS